LDHKNNDILGDGVKERMLSPNSSNRDIPEDAHYSSLRSNLVENVMRNNKSENKIKN
jgi:hypothetical protein